MTQPTIETPRLILRPFGPGDAPAVRKMAGQREIADTTLSIPHPYEDGMAEQWIGEHRPGYEAGTLAVFAIVLGKDRQLVGAISLAICREHDKAELGYWMGQPFWNQGYATEAAAAVLEFGFSELRLNRISSRHLVRNPASGRVMEKVGMSLEGTVRQEVVKWDKYEDMALYGILRDDWSRR